MGCLQSLERLMASEKFRPVAARSPSQNASCLNHPFLLMSMMVSSSSALEVGSNAASEESSIHCISGRSFRTKYTD